MTEPIPELPRDPEIVYGPRWTPSWLALSVWNAKARWRARRRQHRHALDGDTNAYLHAALPESCTHEHWAWHQSPFGDPEWSQCLDCGEYGVDVAGRPDHDNGDLAASSTTPKHRKPPHA